ncbi:hypothetical protein ACWEN3_17705 [Streptomyces sp. NPDC004561]
MSRRVIDVRGRIHEFGPRLEHAPEDVVHVGRRRTMGGWGLLPDRAEGRRPAGARPSPATRTGRP